MLTEDIKAEGYRELPREVADLLYDITNVSSTTSFFQVIDPQLLLEIKKQPG